MLVISSSVAHDLYYRVLNPQASEAARLRVGRIVIGVAVLIAGYFGINPPGFVGEGGGLCLWLGGGVVFSCDCAGYFQQAGGHGTCRGGHVGGHWVHHVLYSHPNGS